MDLIKKKIYKTSKPIYIILFIACVLVVLSSLVFSVGIGILSFTNGSLSESLKKAFVIPSSKGIIEVLSASELSILFTFAIIQLIIIFFIILTLHRIFLDISRTYSPFTIEQVRRMKLVALLTIIIAVVSSVFDGMADIILYGSGTLNIEPTWFVISIVIYCMAHIFEYGCLLQQESDETL